MVDLPADDGTRQLTLADPDDDRLAHVAIVGDTYTILVSTAETAGRYCLIDMLIPAGGGPPPHRHDFEELFHVLSGTVEVTLRETTSRAEAGQTVNVPANAPHAFHNPTDGPLRLLCLTSPGGLDEYFLGFGDRLPTRSSPAPQLSETELGERMRRAAELAPRYRIDMLGAGGAPRSGGG
jgi:quercetin dioxygenase-like cupin family protein